MYATCAASKMSKESQEIVVLSIRLSAGISPKGQNFMLDSAAFNFVHFSKHILTKSAARFDKEQITFGFLNRKALLLFVKCPACSYGCADVGVKSIASEWGAL
jgi:hypothetical protein